MASKLILFYIINLFQLKIWLGMYWGIQAAIKGAIARQEIFQLDAWPRQPKRRHLPLVALIGLLT